MKSKFFAWQVQFCPIMSKVTLFLKNWNKILLYKIGQNWAKFYIFIIENLHFGIRTEKFPEPILFITYNDNNILGVLQATVMK